MKPDVSVIMPVYNAEPYVAKAINSILNQTFADFEFIVVDDASSDGSSNVIRSFNDDRIINLFLEQNQGYPNAMNHGLRHAKGRYIARMDSDDISHPDRLKRQVDFLDAHPEYVFVGSWNAYITPNGKITVRNRQHLSSELSDQLWLDENWQTVYDCTRHFADPSVMFRFHHAQNVGFYRTYQRSGQDVDLWLRMLEQYEQAATLNEILYYRNLVPESITELYGRFNWIPRELALERKNTGADRVMRGEPIMDHTAVVKKAPSSSFLWKAARISIEAGDMKAGLDFIVLAIKREGISKNNLKNSLKTLKTLIKYLPAQVPG